MAGQDLLDQGRAGAGQAHDEDRVGARVAHARPLGEECRRIERLRPGDVGRHLAGVVVEPLATQRIALAVVLEGLLETSGVLEGLAEREVQVEAVLRAQVVARQRGAHRLDVRVAEADRLEVGQAPPALFSR
jgi:hypothetical protein